ncbi:MAG: flagellar filament outer layer protein FlaA [Spirochaetia bacterium]|nr:flagellar filament outer layer protein FlaA [Spirochaetia bacterium]
MSQTVQDKLIDDFSSLNGWHLKHSWKFRGNLLISDYELPVRPESGSYLQIQFSGVRGSGFRLRRKETLHLLDCTHELSIEVFGFGDIFEIHADLRDVRNRFIRVPAGIQKHRGWKKISIPIKGIRSRRIRLNDSAEGIKLEGFYIKALNTNGKARLLLDEIRSKRTSCLLKTDKIP